MPGMDGHEVARAIRAEAHNGHVRLIALTGWGQEGDRERTRASGFDHHLTKPVDLAALQRLLLEDVRERQPAV
jgi:CheY-like chemotaxis protein